MEPKKEGRGGTGNRIASLLASDAALIGGLTILGYLVAYSYQIGKAYSLDIPIVLVSVSLETCLLVLAALLVSIFFAVTVVNLVMAVIPERLHGNILLRVGAVLFFTSASAISAGAFLNRAAYLFVIVPIILIGYFSVLPFLENKGGRTYFQRLNDRLERNAKSANQRAPGDWLDARLGLPIGWMLWIPVFATVVSYECGRAEGQFDTRYFATLSRPPEVLLERYGDMLVFRRLGTTTVTIKVVGKDQIPPLAEMHTGSMASADKSQAFLHWGF